ncbi:unnamed protein product [Leuciscus chuanchicus]
MNLCIQYRIIKPCFAEAEQRHDVNRSTHPPSGSIRYQFPNADIAQHSRLDDLLRQKSNKLLHHLRMNQAQDIDVLQLDLPTISTETTSELLTRHDSPSERSPASLVVSTEVIPASLDSQEVCISPEVFSVVCILSDGASDAVQLWPMNMFPSISLILAIMILQSQHLPGQQLQTTLRDQFPPPCSLAVMGLQCLHPARPPSFFPSLTPLPSVDACQFKSIHNTFKSVK